jgi:hypothetical protein
VLLQIIGSVLSEVDYRPLDVRGLRDRRRLLFTATPVESKQQVLVCHVDPQVAAELVGEILGIPHVTAEGLAKPTAQRCGVVG